MRPLRIPLPSMVNERGTITEPLSGSETEARARCLPLIKSLMGTLSMGVSLRLLTHTLAVTLFPIWNAGVLNSTESIEELLMVEALRCTKVVLIVVSLGNLSRWVLDV